MKLQLIIFATLISFAFPLSNASSQVSNSLYQKEGTDVEILANQQTTLNFVGIIK